VREKDEQGIQDSSTVQVEQIKKLVATIWRRRSRRFRNSATGRTGGGHQAGKKDWGSRSSGTAKAEQLVATINLKKCRTRFSGSFSLFGQV
jgi:hypothetical protein